VKHTKGEWRVAGHLIVATGGTPVCQMTPPSKVIDQAFDLGKAAQKALEESK